MMGSIRRSALAPWSGLFLGALAWFLHHQSGSEANYLNCHRANGLFVVGAGLFCALVAAAGGWLSWATLPGRDAAAAQNRSFARVVGTAAAAVFLLAIAFQTLAGVLVPACLK